MSDNQNPLPTILVVDDQPNNLRVVGDILTIEGDYHVNVARDGKTALQQVETVKPDLILLDVMMPGMDGYEVCRRLKENPRYRDIPVLFMTAVHETENQLRGFELGGADYLTKPLEPVILLARVKAHLQNYLHLRREVTEKQNLEKIIEERTQELVEINRELSEVNQSKDDFMATVSHELRTPLTSIIGHSEYLLEQRQSDTDRTSLEVIERASKALLILINDILDMSKIASGKFSIDEYPFDLNALLTNIRKILLIRAQDAGLGFEFKQQVREQYRLLGDANRISQVLINLLTNAIKFTHAGHVSLNCWNDDKQLYLEVKDTGIGMSPETLERIFSRFEQADGTISRQFGGTGLGLFISLNLAQLMGGRIDVSSEEGVGSTFTFTLPYRQSDSPVSVDNENSTSPEAALNIFKGRVLVAEDTLELQLLERRILEKLGLNVTIANDGVEAIALAEPNTFDLIFMDADATQGWHYRN